MRLHRMKMPGANRGGFHPANSSGGHDVDSVDARNRDPIGGISRVEYSTLMTIVVSVNNYESPSQWGIA